MRHPVVGGGGRWRGGEAAHVERSCVSVHGRHYSWPSCPAWRCLPHSRPGPIPPRRTGLGCAPASPAAATTSSPRHQHYGAYQFDLPTWRSVGGEGLPSIASVDEQDYRALLLYRMRGWQPWECAGILGLAPEKDARSGRTASRAEAAYMRPAGAPDGSGRIGPTWPGKVFQPGDCDAALTAWQLRMNAWGYDFDGTGCYGEETRRAALALQRRYKLAETGRLGPRTWRAAWDSPP